MSTRPRFRTEPMSTTEEPDFLNQLADTLGDASRSEAVFGQPVERDGVTVIPVARAGWGFGGGVGTKAGEEGLGGGGGLAITPIGYIEIRNGKSRFRRIVSPVGRQILLAGGLWALVWFGRWVLGERG